MYAIKEKPEEVGSIMTELIVHHVPRILTDPGVQSPNDLPTLKRPMAIVLIMFFSALLLIVGCSLCTKRRRNGEISNNNPVQQAEPDAATIAAAQTQGFDKSVVKSLPLVGYSLVKGIEGNKDLSECPVCLTDFEEDEVLRLLPKCGHIFHPDCIDMWVSSHSTCPLCRSGLVSYRGKEEYGEINWISSLAQSHRCLPSLPAHLQLDESRGVREDEEAFMIHEGPPVRSNGSDLQDLSADGAERLSAESASINPIVSVKIS